LTKQAETQPLFDVTISELVPGGQGLATLPDGRKVFVWNALPGEKVQVRIIKDKRSYAEAITEHVIEKSPERIESAEANYLATSPWQVITFDAENSYKNNIVKMQAEQAKLAIDVQPDTITDGMEWNYRNKMEYSFWGDEEGIHLALHQRGSHGKQIVQQLNTLDIRAGDLKTIVVRCNQAGNVAASLFTKTKAFPTLTLPKTLQGLRVYYSNPKSPASVRTKLLYELGSAELIDELAGNQLVYDVDSFFQVNLPVFERALAAIKDVVVADQLIDMYAGVGGIGLSVAQKEVTLVELDPASAAMARRNVELSRVHADVVEASSERALEYINDSIPVVFDPPRAGLHRDVIERVLEMRPPTIAYLSCNPATQMRDLMLIEPAYDIKPIQVFNFFPRTPHIETLAILTRKD
jgi:23S rRNA (uracil1939-C5)-methyltransferase